MIGIAWYKVPIYLDGLTGKREKEAKTSHYRSWGLCRTHTAERGMMMG